MQIHAVKFCNVNNNIKNNKHKIKKQAVNSAGYTSVPLLAYKDFNLNFKARLNRTPENFYDQKFNIDNMPETAKKYLFEDFDERHHMPPAQLQREAFEYLKIADSVQDIKDMYPNEPLFKHLREVKDTRPSTGILLLLKWDSQTSQTPIFKDKNNKDVTTYLLKKVFLEGKTIEEINNDFDNDATDAIKRELGIKDKKYFSQSNIHTLGIRYPKLPYYNSFLATRNDKEYIPPVRKSNVSLSEQTREKISAAMTKWWNGLNVMERNEQIQKMLNGKEMSNSIFAKYQGQIMTIAAAQIGFSEKLSEIFANKYSDVDFTVDFPTFSEQQREIMLEFWNKDPQFRTQYSAALQNTIAEFEAAYYKDDKTHLEELLNKALDLKAKILNKAKEKKYVKREMQKLARPVMPKEQDSSMTINEPSLDLNSTNTVNRLFKKYETEALKMFPYNFKKTFIDFLMKNTNLQTRKEIVAIYHSEQPQELLGINEDELNKIQNKLFIKKEELNDLFNRTHILTAKTNDFLFNKLLYELTKNPQVFKFERGDVMHYIENNKLESYILQHKDTLNKDMKKLETTVSGRNLLDFCHLDFDTAVILHINQGFDFYPEYNNNLPKMGYALDLNHQNPDRYKEFLKNYNAAIKYYKDPKNDKTAKAVIMEHMIVDYINWLAKNGKNNLLHYIIQPSTKVVPKNNDLDKNYNLDLNSEFSLKKGLKQYLHKNETKYWPDDIENDFLNFAVNRTYVNKEALCLFFCAQIDKFKSIWNNLSKRDKRVGSEVVKIMNKMLHEDFAQEYPHKANAITAAIESTLYDISENPEAFSIPAGKIPVFVKSKYLDKKLAEQKQQIQEKYNHNLQFLPQEQIQNFKEKEFLPRLLKLQFVDLMYEKIDNLENFEKVLKAVVNNAEHSSEELNTYLENKSAFIRLFNNDSLSDEAKDRLLEKIMVDFIRLKAKEQNLKLI